MQKYLNIYHKLKESMTINGVLHQRFNHSVATAKTALELNHQLKLGLDDDKVYLAGLLHDAAKLVDNHILWQIIEQHETINVQNELINYPHLWHSFAGKYYVKEKFQINDEEILNAIYYHTTGKAQMNSLEALIFVSDYIEPTRAGGDYLLKARNACNTSLDYGVCIILSQMIDYLQKSGKIVYSQTLIAYNYYKLERKYND